MFLQDLLQLCPGALQEAGAARFPPGFIPHAADQLRPPLGRAQVPERVLVDEEIAVGTHLPDNVDRQGIIIDRDSNEYMRSDPVPKYERCPPTSMT